MISGVLPYHHPHTHRMDCASIRLSLPQKGMAQTCLCNPDTCLFEKLWLEANIDMTWGVAHTTSYTTSKMCSPKWVNFYPKNIWELGMIQGHYRANCQNWEEDQMICCVTRWHLLCTCCMQTCYFLLYYLWFIFTKRVVSVAAIDAIYAE